MANAAGLSSVHIKPATGSPTPRNQLNETRRSSSVRIASASRFCVALGDAARTVVT